MQHNNSPSKNISSDKNKRMINNFLFSIISDNQNYLNYNQAAPQGRFLSSYSQNSRNGFFPVRQNQNQQPGSYQSQELFVDNLDSRFQFQQPYPVSLYLICGLQFSICGVIQITKLTLKLTA